MPGTILAFDTSAAHCAAALFQDDTCLAAICEPMKRGQGERLFPLLEELLAGVGKDWRDLAVIGVGVGPGNFTGIRLSVSAARGLSLSLNIPAVGVTSLEALAHGHPRPCVALVDARLGRAYAQTFENSENRENSSPTLLEMDEIETLYPALPRLTLEHTDGAEIAKSIAQIAATRWQNAPAPAPLYIRAADAAPSSDPPPVILDAT
ncbi:MAG: tRNA (adenosine(37)-N6)-threonylcarbamoyltransferase complex dimerization subunit type 1 TsaB [Rhodobacterales bacterium]|nr:MAG: tRNA (adenosine(37)-N6)-threonylcarbamoyltransferase complex dimerization subunit type 1 TsaB [Rhodobacterales bacterium]